MKTFREFISEDNVEGNAFGADLAQTPLSEPLTHKHEPKPRRIKKTGDDARQTFKVTAES